MNTVEEIKNPLNEWNVILIYYVMDFSKSQKLKILKHLKKYLKNMIFLYVL
jgi:signal recognition particle subunit SEC65